MPIRVGVKWHRDRYYERCPFNSGTNASPYHVAVRNSWKLRYFQGEVVSNNGMKFCFNPFTLSKVIEIESSNMRSRLHWLK